MAKAVAKNVREATRERNGRDRALTNQKRMKAKIDQGAVKVDPAIKFQLKIMAARSATSIKQLVEDALRIAAKTDPRFRFEENGGRK